MVLKMKDIDLIELIDRQKAIKELYIIPNN
jgi:hypothetical protein